MKPLPGLLHPYAPDRVALVQDMQHALSRMVTKGEDPTMEHARNCVPLQGWGPKSADYAFHMVKGAPFQHPSWILDASVAEAFCNTILPYDHLPHKLKLPFPAMAIFLPKGVVSSRPPRDSGFPPGAATHLRIILLTEDVDWRHSDGGRPIHPVTLIDGHFFDGDERLVSVWSLFITAIFTSSLSVDKESCGASTHNLCVGDPIQSTWQTSAEKDVHDKARAECKARHPRAVAQMEAEVYGTVEQEEFLVDMAQIRTDPIEYASMQTRIVHNFLMTLHAGFLDETRVPMTTRGASKARKLPVDGRAYTYVRLGSRACAARRVAEEKSASRSLRDVRAHLVRGHWHSYWRLSPGDDAFFDTSERTDGKILYLIRYWIPPYKRGFGDIQNPVYRSHTRERNLPKPGPAITRVIEGCPEVETSFVQPEDLSAALGQLGWRGPR